MLGPLNKRFPDYALVVGNRAEIVGWFSEAGDKLKFDENGLAKCSRTGIKYKFEDGKVVDLGKEWKRKSFVVIDGHLFCVIVKVEEVTNECFHSGERSWDCGKMREHSLFREFLVHITYNKVSSLINLG